MKEENKMGKVWLAGAGPGDAGLLTVKAAGLLCQADVIVYDALISTEVLSLIPGEAETIPVGKRAGNHPVPQEEINRILVREAKKGKKVLRLKGGDPFVFGRGGEELELLVKEGVPFEVVPGIPSPVAVPAYAGIPVTHRDYTSSFHVITGHRKKDGRLDIDFPSLVRLEGTLVFLMSISTMDLILRGLLDGGMDPDMPAAVLERGATSVQRRVTATVSTLKAEADRAGIRTPAIIIVGRVCTLADTFHWVEDRLLGGRQFLVTRPRQNMAPLASALRAAGAQVIEMPAIRTVPICPNERLSEALVRFAGCEKGRWLVFTSPVGVQVFFDTLRESRIDLRSVLWGQGKLRIGAIGTATGDTLMGYGLIPDLIPETFCAGELGRELAEQAEPGEYVLILRAELGSEELLPPLISRGLSFEDVPLYRTEYEEAPILRDEVREQLACGEIDAVVFTSASTVRGFVRAAGMEDYDKICALCIGEQTARAAREYGMKTVTAEQATTEGLVSRITEIFGNHS